MANFHSLQNAVQYVQNEFLELSNIYKNNVQLLGPEGKQSLEFKFFSCSTSFEF